MRMCLFFFCTLHIFGFIKFLVFLVCDELVSCLMRKCELMRMQDMSFSDWLQTLVSCDSVGFVMACQWSYSHMKKMTHLRQVSCSFSSSRLYCHLIIVVLAYQPRLVEDFSKIRNYKINESFLKKLLVLT